MEILRQRIDAIKRTTSGGLAILALAGCSHSTETKIESTLPAAAVSAQTPDAAIQLLSTRNIDAELQANLQTTLKDYPGNIDVAVRNRNNGQLFHYTNAYNPERTYNTASTIKLSILEKLLLINQQANLPFITCDDHPEVPMPVQLTCDQLDHALPMIEQSSDNDASALWTAIGGPQTINEFNQQIGATHSTADPDSQWGWSQTTAADQLNVIGLLSNPGSPLSTDSKAVINFMLDNVVPEQRWGVGGITATDARIKVKDGWMSYSLQDPTTHTMNSIGSVESPETTYDLAMFTDGNATEQDGIDALNNTATIVYRTLALAA